MFIKPAALALLSFVILRRRTGTDPDVLEAGWYRDPLGKATDRYNDGRVWTDQTR